jgi:hypothetical protein
MSEIDADYLRTLVVVKWHRHRLWHSSYGIDTNLDISSRDYRANKKYTKVTQNKATNFKLHVNSGKLHEKPK